MKFAIHLQGYLITGSWEDSADSMKGEQEQRYLAWSLESVFKASSGGVQPQALCLPTESMISLSFKFCDSVFYVQNARECQSAQDFRRNCFQWKPHERAHSRGCHGDNEETWSWVRGVCGSMKTWGEAVTSSRWLNIFRALDIVFIKNTFIKKSQISRNRRLKWKDFSFAIKKNPPTKICKIYKTVRK